MGHEIMKGLKANKTRTGAICLVILLLFIVLTLDCAAAYDYTVRINETSLPYSGELAFDVTGHNQTVNIGYGRFLSGPTSVELANGTRRTIVGLVHVPSDFYGSGYTSSINLSDNVSYSVRFSIVDNVYFDLITGPQCFVGTPHEIIPEAPVNSTLSIRINGKYVQWSGEPILYYTPATKGPYTMIADFSYRNHTQRVLKNFTAYDALGCSISSKAKAEKNETVQFSGAGTGGMGGMSYSWDFGDRKTSSVKTPSHAYQKAGRYKVELKVADNEGNKAKCTRDVEVTEPAYSITVILSADDTGTLLGDANVTLDRTTEKSNVDGMAKFSEVTSGSYELGIEKAGFYSYSRKISVSADAVLHVNLSRVKEAAKPVPSIELLYPSDGYVTREEVSDFRFRATSDTPIKYCYLLYNDIAFLGYKIRGEIDSPKSGKEYSFSMNMTNGDFKWGVECENSDGTGMSDERNITVEGLAEAPKHASLNEEAKKAVNESGFKANLTELSSALQEIADAEKKFESSGSQVREVFDMMGFQTVLDKGRADISKVRQEMDDLENLQIADSDKKKKAGEFLADFHKTSSHVPVSITITGEQTYDIDAPGVNVTEAVDKYLRWKGYNLSKRQYDKYVKNVKDAQESLKIRAGVINARILFLDGSATNYSFVRKEVEADDVRGGVFIELIPKSVATSINQVTFSAPFELVEKDPVARLYLDNQSSFNYYVKKKVPLEELKKVQSVVVLDLNDPQNRITGFSILDTSTQTGKFFLVIVLLGVVLSGNYLIFFRDREVRQRIMGSIRGARESLRQRTPNDKLMLILNSVIDQLNAGETENALGRYSRVLELYDLADAGLRQEVRPIIEHMLHELDVFNLNRMIDDAYRKTISGRSYEAAGIYNTILDTMEDLPSGFKGKVSSKLGSLNVAMDIHRLKSHLPIGGDDGNVDDSLFRVGRREADR